MGGLYLTLVVFSLGSAAVSALVVAAQRRGGALGLATAVCLVWPLLLGLGSYRWRADASTESPLMAYVLVAVVPPLVAALVVRLTRNRTAESQWLAGTVSCFGAILPSIFVGTYMLPDVLRL
jgi:hypothetical protein